MAPSARPSAPVPTLILGLLLGCGAGDSTTSGGATSGSTGRTAGASGDSGTTGGNGATGSVADTRTTADGGTRSSGSSLHSEVVAFEVLARCEGATLLATEAEIAYQDPMGTKTDLLVDLVDIDGLTVGVSVTRAVGFPADDPYTVAQATTLLEGKLQDIAASTANVAPADAWVKQILHVIALGDMHVQSVPTAYAALGPQFTADTILLITVTHGDDAFVY